jgi:hypothetical protein
MKLTFLIKADLRVVVFFEDRIWNEMKSFGF